MHTIAEILQKWKLLHAVRKSLRSSFEEHTAVRAECYLLSYRFRVNHRFKTCAGLTRYTDKVIELHPELLHPGREQERNDTMLHEVAHVLAYVIARHRGHTEYWREILSRLGAESLARCHRYSFLTGRSKRYAYVCKDCGHVAHRARKVHKEGKLHLLYHPLCKHKRSGGRYEFRDSTGMNVRITPPRELQERNAANRKASKKRAGKKKAGTKPRSTSPKKRS